MKCIVIITVFTLCTGCFNNSDMSYAVAVSNGFIDYVGEKDPTGELESRIRYLKMNELSLLRSVDNEYVDCACYFVVRVSESVLYDISITCRVDGNHQILAHSPRNPLFYQDFRDVANFQTLDFVFDGRKSRYLIFNCTRGHMHIDALKANKTGG